MKILSNGRYSQVVYSSMSASCALWIQGHFPHWRAYHTMLPQHWGEDKIKDRHLQAGANFPSESTAEPLLETLLPVFGSDGGQSLSVLHLTAWRSGFTGQPGSLSRIEDRGGSLCFYLLECFNSSRVVTVYDCGEFLLVCFLLKDSIQIPTNFPANRTLRQLGKGGLFLPCHMSLK